MSLKMKEKLVHLSIVAIFAALFYSNSFGNFFVWNDWTLIIENFLVRDWGNLPEIFTSSFWKPLMGEPPQIYRPLLFLSFVADFDVWRLNPWGYHLTNTGLHVLNSFLVYFLMRVYVSATTALVGSVLFAVHPIHTEAVTYISGRADLLMSFFILSGILLFLRGARYGSNFLYLLSFPLFFLALLSKETAMIFPLWLFTAEAIAFPISGKRDFRRRVTRLLGPLAVLGAYYLLRKTYVGMTASSHSLLGPGSVDHLLLTLKAIPLYVGLFVCPWNVHFLHPPEASLLVGPQILLSIVLLGGVGWGMGRAARFGNHAVTFALLWLLVGLLPLIHLIGQGLPLLEGWTYLPFFGAFLLVALGLGKLGRWGSSAPLLVALWIAVLLGGRTLYRNWDWKNDMEISLHSVAAAPNDPIALRLIGNAYMRQVKVSEAEKMFRKGLVLAPADPGLHRSLGALYRFLGREADAVAQYSEALESTSKEPYAYWILGHYYLRRGKLAEAEKHFSDAVRIFPHSSELRHDLALAYYLQGKVDAAAAELKAALKISPYSPVLKADLDVTLRKRQP